MTGGGLDSSRPSSGTGGGAWARWWPRVVAVTQLTLGAGILGWETTHAGQRPWLLFVGLAMSSAAPAIPAALEVLGSVLRAGGLPPGGRR